MAKRYVAINRGAVRTLVQGKIYQSVEFDAGKSIARLLKDPSFNEAEILGLRIQSFDDGVFFYAPDSVDQEYVVFDLELLKHFSSLDEAAALLVLQKSVRACMKLWEQMPFALTEKIFTEHDLIVVFPWSFSKADGYRVLIDTKPDAKRQERRGYGHLLVFGFCNKEVAEKPSYACYRKFIEGERTAGARARRLKAEGVVPMAVSSMADGFHPINSHLGFDGWKMRLTAVQREVVNRKGFGPERIEGPAGTGKTLSLILRCIKMFKDEAAEGRALKAAFLAHSLETKESIESIFKANACAEFAIGDRHTEGSSLVITTLQDWCVEELGNKIQESEILDKDAAASKEYQRILIENVISPIVQESLDALKKILSSEFYEFLSSGDPVYRLHSLHHEVSEVIKGRSSQRLDRYKKVPQSYHAVPVRSDEDFDFMFGIYTEYQKKLESTGQFDSDDIVLSALGQLESPIWRRRRAIDGFDVVFVDETHLFNLNELSVVHNLLKDSARTHIIYTIDRSQSVANSSLTYTELKSILLDGKNDQKETSLVTVFRSSPDIVALAFNILASGASVFTSLDNPLANAQLSLTLDEERRTTFPRAIAVDSDTQVVEAAFKAADKLAESVKSTRSKIAIIAVTDQILNQLERLCHDANRAFESIKRRADSGAVSSAEKRGAYLLAGIDYVGGLEFDGVVIVGSDVGHLPLREGDVTDAKHFMLHASYNRIYVAITRAKYGVIFIYNKKRGISDLLAGSVKKELLLDNASI